MHILHVRTEAFVRRYKVDTSVLVMMGFMVKTASILDMLAIRTPVKMAGIVELRKLEATYVTVLRDYRASIVK